MIYPQITLITQIYKKGIKKSYSQVLRMECYRIEKNRGNNYDK